MPTPTQRRGPTFSFSQTAASATVNSGEAKPIAVASVSGRCTKAEENIRLLPARSAAPGLQPGRLRPPGQPSGDQAEEHRRDDRRKKSAPTSAAARRMAVSSFSMVSMQTKTARAASCSATPASRPSSNPVIVKRGGSSPQHRRRASSRARSPHCARGVAASLAPSCAGPGPAISVQRGLSTRRPRGARAPAHRRPRHRRAIRLPGVALPVQKRKSGVPGSPSGQQQLRAEARGKGRTTLACGGGAATGATAAGVSRRRSGAASRSTPSRSTGAGGAGGAAGRRGGATGRGAASAPSASRRIGLGRAARFSRCALPTTAFLEMPMRRPISAVECPSAQKARS